MFFCRLFDWMLIQYLHIEGNLNMIDVIIFTALLVQWNEFCNQRFYIAYIKSITNKNLGLIHRLSLINVWSGLCVIE